MVARIFPFSSIVLCGAFPFLGEVTVGTNREHAIRLDTQWPIEFEDKELRCSRRSLVNFYGEVLLGSCEAGKLPAATGRPFP